MSKIIAKFELRPEDFLYGGVFSDRPSAYIALSDYTGGDYDNVYINIMNDVKIGGPWWKRVINWISDKDGVYSYVDVKTEQYDYFHPMSFDTEYTLDGRFETISNFTVEVTVVETRGPTNNRVLCVTTVLNVEGCVNDDY